MLVTHMSLTFMTLFFSLIGKMQDEKAMDDQLKAIGNRLRELRVNGKYKCGYAVFAIQHANIQPRQYWRLEAGEANFTIKTLLKVLDVHELSLEEFFEGL